MKKIKVNEMCDYLEDNFPEFKDFHLYHEEDKKLTYVFFGAFCTLLDSWIEENNEAQIKKFFKFANDYYQTELDDRAENLFGLELLDNRFTDKEQKLFTENLTGKALESFIKSHKQVKESK